MELNGAKILYTIHTNIPLLGDFKITQTLVSISRPKESRFPGRFFLRLRFVGTGGLPGAFSYKMIN